MEAETWVESPSICGLLASSIGRIKLPERERSMPRGGFFTGKTSPTFGYKTKSNKNAKHVYLNVSNRHLGNLKVHRIICEAFHGPQPSPKHVVIHIDENPLNNNSMNLKWGTQKENLNMPKFISYCKSRVGELSPAVKGRR